jgi:hypothetical protein
VYATLFACADRVIAAGRRVQTLMDDGGLSPEQITQARIELNDLRQVLLQHRCL